jgi:hypothetical protein
MSISIDRVCTSISIAFVLFIGEPGDVPLFITDSTAVTQQTGWVPKKATYQTLEEIYQWIVDKATYQTLL